MTQPQRLDVALFARGLAESRSKARGLVEDGAVTVNGRCCQKCATPVTQADVIAVKGGKSRFVSRGGYKLLKAIEEFRIGLEGLICMDVGASTGGFTDCMLQQGAKKVYAVDVGTDQLAESLRRDARVICKEQCNFRYATRRDIPEAIDFASADVSFISLDKILPTLYALLAEEGRAVCLIKPQFEAGKENISKNGVVRNKNVHVQVLTRVLEQMAALGFSVLGLTYSPIKGPQGNIEYLAFLTKSKGQHHHTILPGKTVEDAFKELGDKG